MATTLSKRATTKNDRKVTTSLLVCGVVAGPLFIGMSLILARERQGFDLTQHVISLLLLGDPGWIQFINFVVTGLLAVAYAYGMWRLLHPGRGGTWGPMLVGVYGVALITAGFFRPDPEFGFPSGAPSGVSSAVSGHATMYRLFYNLFFAGRSVLRLRSPVRRPPPARMGGLLRSDRGGCFSSPRAGYRVDIRCPWRPAPTWSGTRYLGMDCSSRGAAIDRKNSARFLAVSCC